MSVCTILSQGTNISDADAAVGDVKDGKFFYSVEEPIKEGTIPTVAISAGSDTYPTGYHAGDAGGLDAIDTDFVVSNIKDGVTMFGKLGTYSQTITHDDQDNDVALPLSSYTINTQNTSYGSKVTNWYFHTLTVTLAQASVVHATTGGAYMYGDLSGNLYLYIDGTFQGSDSVPNPDRFYPLQVIGNKACASGDRTIQGRMYSNFSGGAFMYHMAATYAGVSKTI